MRRYFTCFLLLSCAATAFAQQANLALSATITANSTNPAFPASNAIDGRVTRNSKWMSADVRPPHLLELAFANYCNISSVVIHTGIPESERTPAEAVQAAGFWSAKNFKLQYWDDANWTDIAGAEIHENRLTEVTFNFATPINTSRIRLVCDDGEPISIMEFQVFGVATPTKAPVVNMPTETKTARTADQSVSLNVTKEVVGKTMKYVGYNQGYYMPGSNASGWIEYSGVNSLRIWTTLNSYVPLTAVQVDKSLANVDDFDRRKNELRQNPEHNRFVNWKVLEPIYASPEKVSNTNPMILDYVMSELNRLNIDPIVQIGSTDFNDSWGNKWQQWQRYYALAYYMAKKGNVTRFALQNEPNHKNSGMKLDQWIGAMQIVSDALSCAIADVNKKYGKHLEAKLVGPVTAGNNPEWWSAIARAVRTDYHGKPIDHDLIGIFSTHSYNSPAAGYANRVNDIRKIIVDNHPAKQPLPIVYTEIGRWMNAYLIDKAETMDSPSLFTEWAGIYTNNTLNGAYGMWAFKFSNTSSETYPEGVKSGHHFTWQGERIVEDAYVNLLADRPVKTYNGSLGGMITDGIKNDLSSWTSDSSSAQKWVSITIDQPRAIGSAVVYTGSAGGVYTAPDRLRNFSLQYLHNDVWTDIPGATFKDNKYAQLFFHFKQAVTASAIRLVSDDPGIIKIREIKVFGANDGPRAGQQNYDVSGIQRTGEVVRLFAKGFKDERPLIRTISSVSDENLDALTAFDPASGNYYTWLVQRGSYTDKIDLDLSALKLPPGAVATAERVGRRSFGEVSDVVAVPPSGKIRVDVGPQDVVLLTITPAQLVNTSIKPSADATVAGGTFRNQNYGSQQNLDISLDASAPKNNKVALVGFHLPSAKPPKRALLRVTGMNVTDTANVRIHVYAIPGRAIDEKRVSWATAPQLDQLEALVTGVGNQAFVAGELAMDNNECDRYLDVTMLLQTHPALDYTFVLVRETRQLGDDEDKGRIVRLGSKESAKGPALTVWTR